MPSRLTSPTRVILALAVGLGVGGLSAALAGDPMLPRPTGPVMPRVAPIHSDEGLYRQSWFQLSFLDLREDFADAKTAGKRLAVLFEQRGCVYCASLHNDVLAVRYINDYVRENFAVVQLDLWGAREVTDFDGTVLSERALAERWGVIFTPTIVFLKDDLTGLEGKWRARGHRAPAAQFQRRHLLRLVRLGTPQALRARPQLPALPHRAHGRARGAEAGAGPTRKDQLSPTEPPWPSTSVSYSFPM
jgi:Thioredoxin-like domain